MYRMGRMIAEKLGKVDGDYIMGQRTYDLRASMRYFAA